MADGKAAALALARACDVLIGWDLGGLPAELKRLNPRLKVVLVSHATPDSEWGLRAMSRLDGVDAVVAVSELAIGAGDPGTRVIWNAVDVDRLEVRRSRAEMRARWGIPEGALVAGQLGRLSTEKGPRALAAAIGHLPGPWHAVVVGEGPERPDPAPRLHLAGGDPAAGDVLNALDALVVASDYESFGLTIAEGLWMGVPVISTRSGLAKLEPGLVREIPVGVDGPTLARAILEAHASGPMPGSREFARERCSPDRFGREWTAQILELAPPPTRTPTPGLDRQLRLAALRRECPSGSKPSGCGCGDTLACSRTGRQMTRAECYSCLEAEAHLEEETTP
jgi:glycosyltransferase involved in cell wall biosynthesis